MRKLKLIIPLAAGLIAAGTGATVAVAATHHHPSCAVGTASVKGGKDVPLRLCGPVIRTDHGRVHVACTVTGRPGRTAARMTCVGWEG